jgi:hypothetical protein
MLPYWEKKIPIQEDRASNLSSQVTCLSSPPRVVIVNQVFLRSPAAPIAIGMIDEAPFELPDLSNSNFQASSSMDSFPDAHCS